jgi:hypothetical protein
MGRRYCGFTLEEQAALRADLEHQQQGGGPGVGSKL